MRRMRVCRRAWRCLAPPVVLVAAVLVGVVVDAGAVPPAVATDDAWTVVGRVMQAGRPLGGVVVDLVDADDVPAGGAVRTAADGSFSLPSARRGLFVRARDHGGAMRWSVGAVPVEHVDLELHRNPPPRLAPTKSVPEPTIVNVTLEDFEDGSVADYSVVGSTFGGVSAAGAHDGSAGLTTREDVFPGWLYRTANLITRGDEVTAWVRPGATGRGYVGFGSSAAGTFAVAVGVNTNSCLLQYIAYQSPHEVLAEIPFVWTPGQWYRVSVLWTVTGLQCTIYGSNGTTVLASVTSGLGSHAAITSGSNAWRAFGSDYALDSLQRVTPPAGVPTLSEWGQIAFVLLLLGGGAMLFGRGRPTAASASGASGSLTGA